MIFTFKATINNTFLTLKNTKRPFRLCKKELSLQKYNNITYRIMSHTTSLKESMTKFHLLFLYLIVGLALVLSSCKEEHVSKKSPQYVKTTVAESVGEESMVSYPGKTKASDVVNASFKVSGTLSRVLVKEGDYVKKGQLIAEIDSHDYEVQLHATEAEHAQIKADAERIISMYNEGTATASNYDKARYGLQQINEKLAHHRDQVQYCKLYAPMSGYVQSRLHDSGENVSAGMPIVSLFSSSNIEVEIFIPGSDYNRRKEMLRAICTFDAMPENIYSMDIARMSKEANANQLYMVRLSFKPGSDISKLTPGMTTMVYVSYIKDGSAGTVKIPSSCVLRNKDRSIVFIFDKQSSVVRPRVVTTGNLDTRGNIEVTSGLESGETVVSAGVRFLKPGQKVKEADKTSVSNVGRLL